MDITALINQETAAAIDERLLEEDDVGGDTIADLDLETHAPPPSPPAHAPPPRPTQGEKRKRRAISPHSIRMVAPRHDPLNDLSEEDRRIVATAAMVGITGDKVINSRHFNSQEFRTPHEVKRIDMSTWLQYI